jgi:uncharacterized protein (DUF2147 family)
MMKKITALVLVLALSAAVSFAADPVEGCWLSVDEKTGKITAGWEIYQEGGKLFGKILSTPDTTADTLADKCKESYKGFPLAGKVNQMKVRGTVWIFGLSMDKTGQWSGGSVIDPGDGNIYKCKITFHAAGGKYKTDTLEMRGEIGLGIGRSQFWQRTDLAAAGALGTP